MADPFELAEQMKQNAHMAALVKVLQAQADSAERASRRAWALSICSTVITVASLAVAIIALLFGV